MRLRRSTLLACLCALAAAAGWGACSLNPRTLDDPNDVSGEGSYSPESPGAAGSAPTPMDPGSNGSPDDDGIPPVDDNGGETAPPSAEPNPDAGQESDAALGAADAGAPAVPSTTTPR